MLVRRVARLTALLALFALVLPVVLTFGAVTGAWRSAEEFCREVKACL